MLFKKAKELVKNKKVILDGVSKKVFFFRIKQTNTDEELLPEEYYDVAIYYEDYVLKHSCTCKYCSLKPDKLCSHKLACFYYLIENSDKLNELLK